MSEPESSRPSRGHAQFVIARLDGRGCLQLNGRRYVSRTPDCPIKDESIVFGTYDRGSNFLNMWGTEANYRSDDEETIEGVADTWSESCRILTNGTGEFHWEWWNDDGEAHGDEPQAVCSECMKPANGKGHGACWRSRDMWLMNMGRSMARERESERYDY